jgi:photosystem II stability/assembly factor-like uncharacterized protein
MSKKLLIIGIFLFLLLFLAGNASSEVEPVYAGWTVGDSWDDGSGTSYGTILRSTDSGETWVRQGVGQIAKVNMFGVFAVDPYTAWVVGNSDNGYATIYHTTDGGITWQRKGSAPDAPNVDLVKVAAYGDNKVWAVGKSSTNVILHTSDGGATWTNQIPAEYEDVKLQGVHTPDGTNVWVTGGLSKDDNGLSYALILKSTDAGLSWTRQSGGDVADADHLLGISAVDENTAWAVGGDVIDGAYIALHTIDGGTNWVRQDGVEGLWDANEVYAVNASVVWAACDHSVFWSTNGGESWGNHNVAPYTMDISAVSSQEAWAARNGVGGCIYHTANGGSTWTTLEELNGEPLPQVQGVSFATQPINPDYLIISLIEDVEQLVDEGSLNQGQGNALIKKLEHALDRLDDDRLKAAINALGAFSNQVDAFVRGGVLWPEDGQNLSDQVNDIIELLSFPL